MTVRRTARLTLVDGALASTDTSGLLQLVLTTLASQRRTNAAMYRLVRCLAAEGALPDRGTGRQVLGRWLLRDRTRSARPARAASPAVWRRDEATIEPTPECAPVVSIHCFGRFEVVRDGKPVHHWRRGTARSLLKHLVARRHPVPREVLLDLLWPSAGREAATNGLRVALHALRQVLGRSEVDGLGQVDYVVCDRGNYALDTRAPVRIDTDEFNAHFEAGLRLDREGRFAAAARHYESAEAIYRDDYLLEDLYEDWTLLPREEFRDRYLLVLTKLADHCLRQGDREGCILRCHKVLERDACREDAYQRLMRCYAELGQRSRAMHWYEVCVRTLRRELEVAPSDLTRSLHEQISALALKEREP